MSTASGCPRCSSFDVRRVKRRWWDHILRRRRVYRCDGCQHRFARTGD